MAKRLNHVVPPSNRCDARQVLFDNASQPPDTLGRIAHCVFVCPRLDLSRPAARRDVSPLFQMLEQRRQDI